jgi:hypothetical protein
MNIVGVVLLVVVGTVVVVVLLVVVVVVVLVVVAGVGVGVGAASTATDPIRTAMVLANNPHRTSMASCILGYRLYQDQWLLVRICICAQVLCVCVRAVVVVGGRG